MLFVYPRGRTLWLGAELGISSTQRGRTRGYVRSLTTTRHSSRFGLLSESSRIVGSDALALALPREGVRFVGTVRVLSTFPSPAAWRVGRSGRVGAVRAGPAWDAPHPETDRVLVGGRLESRTSYALCYHNQTQMA